MFIYPKIDPILIHIGPLKIHWYGMMYLLAFLTAYYLATNRSKKNKDWQKNSEQISDLVFYGAMGVVIGGRLGYIFFYDFKEFLIHPTIIYQVWNGGMSFHGGFLGVLVAMWKYGHRYNLSFWSIMDFVAPLVPLGLLFGRIGNFINGELWGRPVVDVNYPLSIIFTHVDNLPRHPSQLYEAALEGLLLFMVLWLFSDKKRPEKSVSALFLIGYGLSRCFVEFFREPDFDKGFIAFGWLTMGQLLSIPMIFAGIVLFISAYYKTQEVKD
jgi:phosphatidylglycerol:prolipoprotein diacylglycerol transferase